MCKAYPVAQRQIIRSLFYDWLHFQSSDIMNIEPAMLLMIHSVPKHTDITESLLSFLIRLVNNSSEETKVIVQVKIDLRKMDYF